MTPRIIVLSGPGGVGKTTIANAILQRFPELLTTITKLTTRPMRPNEQDGQEFHFLSKEAFEAALTRGELLEHNFFNGNYYGVPKAPLDQVLSQNLSPVLVVDVNGARAVRTAYPNRSLLIFITAPLEQLKSRYIARGQTAAEAEERLAIAQRDELPNQAYYDAVIENVEGQPDRAIEAVAKLIQS